MRDKQYIFCLFDSLVLALAFFCAPVLPVQAEGRAAVRYAKGFSIEYRTDCKVLRVTDAWPGVRDSFVYVLYPRGAARPQYQGRAQFIQTPVKRVVSYSSTYLPEILAFGGAESIIGVDSADYVYSPEVRARIISKQTVETTRSGTPNLELLLSLSPDLVLTYGVGNEWDSFPKMQELGLPVVIDGEWNEPTPLGRAEWMKFVACFFNREAEAEKLFSEIEANYNKLKKLAAGAKARPRVLANAPFQGSWDVPGGKSYMAALIEDAGGDYLWASNTSTGGVSLSLEAAYQMGIEADIWISPGAAGSLKELAAMDPRFSGLKVFAAGRVYGNRLRTLSSGANDYFESGVMHPDLVLSDLIRIFHPELRLSSPFMYFSKLK